MTYIVPIRLIRCALLASLASAFMVEPGSTQPDRSIKVYLLEPQLCFQASATDDTVLDVTYLRTYAKLKKGDDILDEKCQDTALLWQDRKRNQHKQISYTNKEPSDQIAAAQDELDKILAQYKIDASTRTHSIAGQLCEFASTDFIKAETLLQNMLLQDYKQYKDIGSPGAKGEYAGFEDDANYEVAFLVVISRELTGGKSPKYQYRLHLGFVYSKSEYNYAKLVHRHQALINFVSSLFLRVSSAISKEVSKE